MQILLIRHAQSTWNKEGRWQGQADPPLSAEGRAQATALAARLRGVPFDVLVSSDLRRALETAHTIADDEPAAADGRSPTVVPRPEFREIDVGTWAGLTRSEIMERHPEQWAAFLRQEDIRRGGAESIALLHERLGPAWDRLLAEARDHEWQSVGLVAHGGVIRSLTMIALGLPSPPKRLSIAPPRNTSISQIDVGGRGVRLVTYNDAVHLN